MRHFALAGALILLSACTTTRRPDQSKTGLDFLISCGSSMTWNLCYVKANQICPAGYATLSEHANFDRNELFVECTEEPVNPKVVPSQGELQSNRYESAKNAVL